MTSHHNSEEPQNLTLRRIKWLMILRLILATFSLGAAALIQINQGKSYVDPYLISLYVIIGIVYSVNLCYAITINRVKSLGAFAYTQIFIDVFLITGLVNATGGVRSIFSLFYYLSIISASIILYRKGSIIVASACSILYGLIVDLEYYGIFQPFYVHAPVEQYGVSTLLFRVVMNVIAFYLIAILSSLLSEQLRSSQSALTKREIDFRTLEVLHRNIVESINSGLLTVDERERITFINRAGEEIIGFSLSEVFGRLIGDIVPEIKKIETMPTREIFSRRFEVSFVRRDGEKLQLGFTKSTLRDVEGISRGEIYVFQDVTKLRELEQHVRLVDRLAAIGRLATGIAHEIRNPLASVSGSVQVLRDSLTLSSDNRRLMEIVLKETDRLNHLLSDFLLFAHPTDRSKGIVELNVLIEEVLQLFLADPLHRHIKVNKNFCGSIMIEADGGQIKQVLWNLFINGAQAMNYLGELSIATNLIPYGLLPEEITSRLTDVGRVWSQLVISDTGCGIAEEDINKIYDPFFTTKENGVGLGLAIVYSIIESYQGTIIVKSRKGWGSQFIIYLPSVSHP